LFVWKKGKQRGTEVVVVVESVERKEERKGERKKIVRSHAPGTNECSFHLDIKVEEEQVLFP
jgi:hypothetical protein